MATLYLFDEISDSVLASFGIGVSSKMLAEALDEIPQDEEVTLKINSPGGIATEGLAMRDLLLQRGNVEVEVMGQAASAATLVMLGGKRVSITESSRLMIHQASAFIMGAVASELEMYTKALHDTNRTIAKIYAKKTGRSPSYFSKVMDPGRYYTAKEAKLEGLVDRIISDENAVQKDQVSALASALPGFDLQPCRPFQPVSISANGGLVYQRIQRTQEENQRILTGRWFKCDLEELEATMKRLFPEDE